MSEEDSPNTFSKLTTGLKVTGAILALLAGTRVIGILGNCSIPGCGVSGSSYDDKISSLSRTDQKLVKYRELKRIKLGLREPKAITIGSGGRLYVSGTKAIEVYDAAKGTRLAAIKLTASPTALSAGPDGNIYAGLRDHIEVYSASGRLKSRWPKLSGAPFITSISASKTHIWAADAGNRVILKYNSAGQLAALVGKKDPAKRAPGIVVPSPHLDVAAAGDSVWVANPGRHELELYAADGTLKRAWGKTSFAIDGFSGCCNPTDFALLPNGKFITSEKGIPRVKIYSSKGKFEGVVAGFETFKPEVVGLDLATDPQDRIYVLDPATNSVRICTGKGEAK